MRNNPEKFFAAPTFDNDEEKTRVAGLLNSILLFVMIATVVALPVLALTTDAANLPPLLLLIGPFIALNLVAYILLRRGNVLLASNLFLITTGIGIFGFFAISEPQSVGAWLSFAILIAFTTLLLGFHAIIRLIVIIITLTFVATLAQTRGWITPLFIADTNPMSNWITSSFIYILTGLGLILSSISLRRALDNARALRERLQTSNQESDELRKILEQREQQRTSELEKRAAHLQAVSGVARSIAAVQDLDSLLPAITRLVSEQFGFYHAGIFLSDDANEFAVLSASNSAGGKRMLDRQHKLRLDAHSIVGYATSRGEPRIALDVGTDAVFFDNPDLPETRSEMALPLRVGGRVIGALDVQSTQTNAFSNEDINVLATLADQVAIAIENTRLFSEARTALAESQNTLDKYVKQEWGSYARQVRLTGFVFDGKQVTPLDNDGKREQRPLPQTGGLSLENASSAISIPIRLRGQTIGVLDVKSRSGQRKWTQDEIALLEAAAERAALALENARLVESAQRRAARERTIGDIAAKIGSVSDINSILQTTVEELGRKIGGATEVAFEFESNEN